MNFNELFNKIKAIDEGYGWRGQDPDHKPKEEPSDEEPRIAGSWGDDDDQFFRNANLPKPQREVDEGRMAEVDQILQDVASGRLDAYDVMNSPKTPVEQAAAQKLQDMYDTVAIDHHLHPDDQFEEILDIVADQLADEYGTDESVQEASNPTGELLTKLAKVIRSVETPDQYKSAQKFANLVFNKLNATIKQNQGFGGLQNSQELMNQIKSDLRAEGKELGDSIGPNTISHSDSIRQTQKFAGESEEHGDEDQRSAKGDDYRDRADRGRDQGRGRERYVDQPSQAELDADAEDRAHKKSELDGVMSWMFPGKKKTESVESTSTKLTECGGMGMGMGMSAQQDSVNMNISMSGSGAGGIRDLLDILRNLDSSSKDAADTTMLLDPIDRDGHEDGPFDNDDAEEEIGGALAGGALGAVVGGPLGALTGAAAGDSLTDPDADEVEKEDFANSPNPRYGKVSDVTASGNDLNRSKRSFKHNPMGGDNKMAETLAVKLAQRYDEIVAESNK